MSNPYTGEVSFEADGKTWLIQFRHQGIVELEHAMGRGIVDIAQEVLAWSSDPKTIKLEMVRVMLWSGLRERHPETDLMSAGDLIMSAGMWSTMQKIVEAFSKAFELPETKDARPTMEEPKT